MSTRAGHTLQRARETQDITLEAAAQVTHIHLRYLKALEAGNLDALPSRAQARGFLRAYAEYLKLDPAPLLAMVEAGDDQPFATPATAETAEDVESEEEAARDLFGKIGGTLRQQRELLGLTLESIEQQIHVRVHYLQALETGDLSGLPSPVQGRGMLNNYASFLGLDPDPLLLDFAEGLQIRHAARQKPAPQQRKRGDGRIRSLLRRVISGDLILGGVLGLALLVFIVWGISQIASTQAGQEPTVTARAIADILIPSATPTITPTPSNTPLPQAATATFALGGGDTEPGEESTPAEGEGAATLPTATPAVNLPGTGEDEAIQIQIVVRQRAWVRVTVDGEIQVEGRVVPGGAYTFSGHEAVEILTGNGAALQVFFNQTDMGPMGIFGEVVSRVFTPTGIVQPTPTIIPTPTPTLTPTPAATATETPTPTAQPTVEP